MALRVLAGSILPRLSFSGALSIQVQFGASDRFMIRVIMAGFGGLFIKACRQARANSSTIRPDAACLGPIALRN